MPSCDWTEYEDACMVNEKKMQELNRSENYINSQISCEEKRKLTLLQKYLEMSEELEKIRSIDKDEKVNQYVEEHEEKWYEDFKEKIFREEREKIIKDIENKVKEQMVSSLNW